jgi:hypothetical protein
MRHGWIPRVNRPAWPDQQSLATKIGRSGWRSIVGGNLAGGIVAMQHATR